MTETGAVECVSIDSQQKKGVFAVRNTLNEVDLNTLQLVSRQEYPFPITALRQSYVGYNPLVRCELLNTPKTDFHRLLTGDLGPSHAALSQPGPLSILHMPSREWDGNGSIWPAQLRPALLPRLRGTIHSGARLSCLTSLPFPFIPREKDLMRNLSLSLADVRAAKAIPGTTLIAAGEYKGKGSLELYGLSPSAAHTTLSTDSITAQRNAGNALKNRQTASASKLLAAAPHGTRIVYADGDGNLKWVERDGFTPVRRWNINPDAPAEPRGILGEFEEAAEREGEEVRGREERVYGRMMRRALERQAHEARWVRGLGLGQ
ncbi:hypothetical protein H2199_002507 [Coniosporium tulheliwenetii]|uniref:Uncharacterized protein n=1 Tax=Coniosporium tulheliwenetii TaxID=3383036 RepID=A0ACC2ZFT3_9PEZI|nr:hypothetical protein H2199_002507 [Cladosporium sp. JES 115]